MSSKNQQKTTGSNCDCTTSNSKTSTIKSNKDVIVITIETCCNKKTCAGLQGTHSSKESSRTHEETQETRTSQSSSNIDSQVSETDSNPTPIAHSTLRKTEKRSFKLPIVTERHHGSGCVMEICILEKHEKSCVYKKDPAEGRTIDDRVGSYECIGRMVFKTCNSDELESGSTQEPASQNVTPAPAPSSTSFINRKSTSDPTPLKIEPRQSSVQLSNKDQSLSSVYGSARSQRLSVDEKTKFYDAEDNLSKKDQQVLMSLPVPRPLRPAIAYDRFNVKYHYPGDDCKLQPPKSPLRLSGAQFDKVYCSTKAFPKLIDDGNQTDTRSEDDISKRASFDTITSLSDLSRSNVGMNAKEQPKSGFFSSFFKRGSSKSPGHFESKRFRK